MEKNKKTCLERFGVEHPMQNKEFFEKFTKSCFAVKIFRDTDIWYQGSYELDFLNKYYDKYPEITRGPRISYQFDGKEHYYFPDFYIPSKNLIIEIKSTWTYDKLIDPIKEKFVKLNGYNYIMILDKNYINFENFISL